MTKYFCFRFDVDTHRCLRVGIPNLIDLGQELDVSFTFFVNMGRAIIRSHSLQKLVSPNPKQAVKIVKLSNLKKLGVVDYVITSVLNPEVGSSQLNVIKYLYQTGHEVGLHGGMNHALWQNSGAEWSAEKIQKEIEWGLKKLAQARIDKPLGFASPGWQGSPNLHIILERLGFRYVADVHSDNYEDIVKPNTKLNLIEVPTNIVGEPGGVGYIEHLRARGLEDGQIIQDFKRRLEGKKLAVVYDHPYYAGIQELPILKKIILTARSMGFEVTTLQNIVRELAI